jgi:hypothetical protein
MKLKLKYFFIVGAAVFLFTTCTKEYSLENGGIPVSGGTSSGSATFILSGASGSCSAAIVGGTYLVNKPMNDSNVVNIIVTVDSVGTYDISTGAGGGISFLGSGIFTATGLQTVSLIGIGVPTTTGIYDFVPGLNGCSFAINVN